MVPGRVGEIGICSVVGNKMFNLTVTYPFSRQMCSSASDKCLMDGWGLGGDVVGVGISEVPLDEDNGFEEVEVCEWYMSSVTHG